MKKIFSHRIIQQVKNYILTRKKLSAAGLVLFLLFGYWGWGKLTSTSGETKYVMAAAQKETIIVSISGSGQVSASNQVDLKAKTSGDVVFVGVKSGQIVKVGTLLVQLDARDAQKGVRDAQANLDSAKLALEKLKKPADNLSLIQAENLLDQSTSNLNKAYDDGFNTVANAFLDLPPIMTGLNDILYGTAVGKGGQSNLSAYSDLVKSYDEKILDLRDSTEQKFVATRLAYDQNFADYKLASRTSDTQTIEQLIEKTYNTSKTIADAVKNTSDFLNFVKDRLTERQLTQSLPAILATHQASLASYTSQTNSDLLNLFGIKDTIASSKRSIQEKKASLDKLKAGADSLDLQSQEISLKQRQNALLDTQETLADAYIRAPFDGQVAKVSVKKLDSVSAGTAAITFITKQKLAEISLNEVDVAKIKTGQKSNITFDAVDGLNITGEVAEIDAVGTVSQGVVTYNIKIAFDTQDDRVKPGMSVSAAIITEVKQDVLAVPVSAIKSSGNNNYVEMFDQKMPADAGNQGVPTTASPRQQIVQIGTANDSFTEIISGLNEGDQIVSRTITPASAAKTASNATPSLFGTPRVGGGGGSSRIPR